MLQEFLVPITILAGVVYSLKARKLKLAGAIAGGLLALLIFYGTGLTGFLMMTGFFLLGTAATSWQKEAKVQLTGIKEPARSAFQVLANAGIPAILAVLALMFPEQRYLWLLMVSGAFASAAADTVSSELGTVYGRRFYNILTFKRDIRGKNGVISLEGTLWGIGASAVITVIHGYLEGWGTGSLWILIAGTAGNLSDSVLGASLENKGVLSNDAVNFLNTLTASVTILLAWTLQVM
jgi:uncharacterized protein (TIGR00297 family)